MDAGRRHPRTWLLMLLLVLSLAGLADAAYLTAKHYTGGPVPCSITGGCEVVMTSRWAQFEGVPTAAFGAAYYLTAFFLTIFYLDARRSWALRLLFALTIVALGASLALLCLMAFVLRSYCQYCLLSDLIVALLFILTLAAMLQSRGSQPQVTTSVSAR